MQSSRQKKILYFNGDIMREESIKMLGIYAIDKRSDYISEKRVEENIDYLIKNNGSPLAEVKQ